MKTHKRFRVAFVGKSCLSKTEAKGPECNQKWSFYFLLKILSFDFPDLCLMIEDHPNSKMLYIACS